MTEDEAKTKWCFAAVASHTNPRSGFDGTSTFKVFPCLGSACMAWRWSAPEEREMRGEATPPEGEGWKKIPGRGKTNLATGHVYTLWRRNIDGFCGLAEP